MSGTSRLRASSGWLALGAVILLATPGPAQVLVENFDDNSLDNDLWVAHEYGVGPQMAATGQRLEMSFPGSSGCGDFGCKLASVFALGGDFDVQVDFELIDWPFGNGVRMALGIDREGLLPHPGVERISFGQNDYPWEPRESYLTDFPDGVHGVTATDDVNGSLRLVRIDGTQTGYYLDAGAWVAIHTGPAPTTDVAINVAAFSAYQFMGWDVLAAFDNLVVNSGVLVWPVASQGSTWGTVKALFRSDSGS